MAEILSLKQDSCIWMRNAGMSPSFGKGSKLRDPVSSTLGSCTFKEILKEFHGDTPNPEAYVFYSRIRVT
jgi:hypothetical protein